MDLEEIRKIVELMEEHGLSLFHLEQEGVNVKLKKSPDPEALREALGGLALSPGVQMAAPPAAPPAAGPKWSTTEVNKMTVPKLKAALTELGLDTSGLKAVLKARLLEAL